MIQLLGSVAQYKTAQTARTFKSTVVKIERLFVTGCNEWLFNASTRIRYAFVMKYEVKCRAKVQGHSFCLFS